MHQYSITPKKTKQVAPAATTMDPQQHGSHQREPLTRQAAVLLPGDVIIGLTNAAREDDVGNSQSIVDERNFSSENGQNNDHNDNVGQQHLSASKPKKAKKKPKHKTRKAPDSTIAEELLQQSPELCAHSRQILLVTAPDEGDVPILPHVDTSQELGHIPVNMNTTISSKMKITKGKKKSKTRKLKSSNRERKDTSEGDINEKVTDLLNETEKPLHPNIPGAHSVRTGSESKHQGTPGAVAILVGSGQNGLSGSTGKTSNYDQKPKVDKVPSTGRLARYETTAITDLERGQHVEEPRQPGAIHVAGIGHQEAPRNGQDVAVALSTVQPTFSETILDREPENRDGTVAAMAVSRDDLEEEVQNRILSQAVVGEVVDLPTKDVIMSLNRERKRTKIALAVIAFAAIIVIAVILGALGKGGDKMSAPDAEFLMVFLQNATMTSFNISQPGGLSLLNIESPQYQAYSWMAESSALFTGSIPDDETARLLLEQYALVTLYYSTAGDSAWESEGHAFLSNQETCLWLKDTSHCTDALVVTLDLADLNLTGTVPRELVFLEQLKMLNLSDNHIEGTFPSSIPLVNFVSVDLHGNLLEGGLPVTPLSDGLQLEYLDLSSNLFSNSLPNELYQISGLKTLILNKNPMSGSISTLIGSLVNLNVFEAGNTSLVGTIPSELGQCSDLISLHLSGSVNITGSVPDEIWLLPNLKRLDTSYLAMKMTLPEDLMHQMTTLEELNLSAGHFFGTIPTQIGLLTNLRILDLSSNAVLSGTIPTEIGLLSSLQTLDLSRATALAGTIPSEIGNMGSLEVFWTFFSAITGQIPSEIGHATSLVDFNGQDGLLLTSFPTELGMLTKLESLDLMFNPGLHGTIPTELGLLTNLRIIRTTGKLSGTLPVELGAATNLEILIFADGMLTGTIPKEYGQLREIRTFVLERQQLTGSLPLTLAALTKMRKSTLRIISVVELIPF